jgi:predicted ester cyclase
MEKTRQDANVRTVRAYIEDVSNRGDIAAIGRYVAADFREHYPPPGLPDGIEGVVALIRLLRDAFEDYQFEVDEMLADGDKVVVRGWGSGRHTAPFMGIAPTGKAVRYRAAQVFLVRDGQLAERWAYPDMLGLLQQLGVAPSLPGR